MLHLDHDASTSTVLSAALLLAPLLWPQPVHALDGFCNPVDETVERSSTRSLREKASRFAPRLQIRVWYEPSDDHQAREQARSSALTQRPNPTQPDPMLPEPVQNSADFREPYGWQISVRWDLVEMAQAVRPSLAEASGRLMPTECLENQTMARRLLLEDGLMDDDALDDEGEEQ